MPPIRSQFSQDLTQQEGKILLALQGIKNGQIQSIRAAAKLYNIPFSTLQERSAGTPSRVDIREHGYKLTQLEEDSLTEWILSMDLRGAAPRPSTIREIANILLAARGLITLSTVGVK
jgi:helix-turn-helix, Psq domain